MQKEFYLVSITRTSSLAMNFVAFISLDDCFCLLEKAPTCASNNFEEWDASTTITSIQLILATAWSSIERYIFLAAILKRAIADCNFIGKDGYGKATTKVCEGFGGEIKVLLEW